MLLFDGRCLPVGECAGVPDYAKEQEGVGKKGGGARIVSSLGCVQLCKCKDAQGGCRERKTREQVIGEEMNFCFVGVWHHVVECARFLPSTSRKRAFILGPLASFSSPFT